MPRESDLHTEDPSPTIPTHRKKEEKGKTVEDNKGASSEDNKNRLAMLVKPPSTGGSWNPPDTGTIYQYLRVNRSARVATCPCNVIEEVFLFLELSETLKLSYNYVECPLFYPDVN